MIRSQGKYFSDDELKRIIMLLRESEMSLPEIADRMNCSRSAVAAINRKFQIRVYGGRRSQWNLNRQPVVFGREEDISPAPQEAAQAATS